MYRIAIECLAPIGHSKARVAFDADRLAKVPASPMRTVHNEKAATTAYTRHAVTQVAGTSVSDGLASELPAFTPRQKDYIFRPADLGFTSTNTQPHSRTISIGVAQQRMLQYMAANSGSSPRTASHSVSEASARVGHTTTTTPAVVGDVAEPFWVQAVQENSAWTDPDELFLLNAKHVITDSDKRMFWEMARAILELPELGTASSNCKIRGAADLTAVLKRPEFRVLWLQDGAQYLPKEIATDLITAAYVPPERVTHNHQEQEATGNT